jgi:hypothetical protein
MSPPFPFSSPFPPLPYLAQLSAEEVRHFLYAHFLSCRALSKIMSPVDAPNIQRAEPLVETLKRYQWLSKYARALCQRKGVKIEEMFGDEIKICDDMVALLPAKIDRMHFLGDSGLTL